MMADNLSKAAAPTTPPRGGKYVRREWTGTRWKYYYASDAGDASGFERVASLEDPTSSHSMEVLAESTTGNPEEDYKAALNAAMAEPGTKFPVAGPAGGPMELEVVQNRKGEKKLRLTAEDGKKVKDFDSRGAYELWYIGTANTSQVMDQDGEAMFTIRPNAGKVRDGEFIPSAASETKTVKGEERTYEAKRWVVQYAKSYPKEKRVGKTSKWFKTSRESAEQHAIKKRNDVLLAQGVKVPMPDQKDDKSAVRQAKKSSFKATPGSVADKIQSGEVPYKIDDNGKRVVDLDTGEKNALIAQAATEFYPAIVNAAKKMTSSQWFQNDDRTSMYGKAGRSGWMERFMGMELEDSPQFAFPDPESPAYQAIEHAINTYDPSHGVGFSGYLAGDKGQLYWKMFRARDEFINEIKGTGSMEGKEGVSRLDTKGTKDLNTEASAVLTGVEDLAEGGEIEQWRDGMDNLLELWEERAPDLEPEKLSQAKEVMANFDRMHSIDKQQMAPRISEAILDLIDWKQVLAVEKSVKEYTAKAMDILTKDKNVMPEHTYSHKEGDGVNARYYYADPMGNQVRYTNAPTGHEDHSSYFGDSAPFPGQPEMAVNPEYFSPEGYQLTRCPECAIEDVEWNPKYNRHDPQNLWMGRWVDQDSGDYRYTYCDSDVRNFPTLGVHQQNALVDVRLPALRQTIKMLFESDKIKDQITALALALLDQGRMRAVEIATLTPQDVAINGNLVVLGTRRIHAGPKVASAFQRLLQYKQPDEPLFSIPQQSADGEVDQELSRRIGPNYLSAVLDSIGVSLLGLQTYHASLRFAAELQRYLEEFGADWDSAVQAALLAAMLEWGHDFTAETDAAQAMQLAQAVLIDPVVASVLYEKAQQAGLGQQAPMQPLPPAMIPVPHVTIDAPERTGEELEFSAWLHSVPIHQYAA